MAGPNDLSILSGGVGGPAASPAAGNPLAAQITTLQQLVQGQSALIAALNAMTVQLSTLGGFVSVPATAADPGVAGQLAYEPGWLYVCVTANTWERTALATF